MTEPATIELVPVGDLRTDPSNVRHHDERNIEAIKGSLTRFGQQKPIVVDAKGVVVAGNGTLEAARSLGWGTVAVVHTDLQGAEATAYAIADNRTAELAAWDDEALAKTLSALQDEESIDELTTGFTAEEIEQMIGGWTIDSDLADAQDYDPSKHEFYTIKVLKVAHDDRDDVLGAINELLTSQGGKYRAEAF